jgi:hypothetical protein
MAGLDIYYSRRGKYNRHGKYNHCALRRRFWSVKKFFSTFFFFEVNFKQIHTGNKKKKFENKMYYWLKRRFKQKIFLSAAVF